MEFMISDGRPIFLQLAKTMEDAILSGAFQEETQLPSTTELSVMYKINPATALKGINILVDNEIAYKKRGLGIYVKEGAKKMLQKQRKKVFYEDYVISLLREAQKLGIDVSELIEMITKGAQS